MYGGCVVPWGECKVLPCEELEKLQWLKTDQNLGRKHEHRNESTKLIGRNSYQFGASISSSCLPTQILLSFPPLKLLKLLTWQHITLSPWHNTHPTSFPLLTHHPILDIFAFQNLISTINSLNPQQTTSSHQHPITTHIKLLGKLGSSFLIPF